MVDDSAEEGGELGIAFASAGDGVNGSLRVGMLATGVGKLGLVAGMVVSEEGAGFVEGVVVGDAVELAAELLLFEELRLFVGRGFVKAGDKENLRGATAGFAPTVEIGEFGTLERCFLVVARVLDGIGLLYDKEFYVLGVVTSRTHAAHLLLKRQFRLSFEVRLYRFTWMTRPRSSRYVLAARARLSLLAVDDFVLADGAVDLGKGMGEVDTCHIIWFLMG